MPIDGEKATLTVKNVRLDLRVRKVAPRQGEGDDGLLDVLATGDGGRPDRPSRPRPILDPPAIEFPPAPSAPVRAAGPDGTGGPGDAARIAKYQSLDEWSRHYSVVRMTAVPFLMTTAVGVLAFGWDRPEVLRISNPLVPGAGLPMFSALGAVVWLATALLMVWLTRATLRTRDLMLGVAGALGIETWQPERPWPARPTGRKRGPRLVVLGLVIAGLGGLAAFGPGLDRLRQSVDRAVLAIGDLTAARDWIYAGGGVLLIVLGLLGVLRGAVLWRRAFAKAPRPTAGQRIGRAAGRWVDGPLVVFALLTLLFGAAVHDHWSSRGARTVSPASVVQR